MIGKRIFIIRLLTTVVIVIATYAIGWYLFTRFNQLSDHRQYVKEEEINNPRLSRGFLNSIIKEFDIRKLYKKDDTTKIDVPEKDPFYE